MIVLAYVAFMGLLVILGWRLGRDTPVVRYLAAIFALFYGLRATILVLGLDTAEPPQFFESDNGGSALAEALWIVSLFLAVLMLAYATTQHTDKARLQIFATRPLNIARMQVALFALSLVAALVTLILISRFGSAADVLRAGKVTQQLSGLYSFRAFAAAAALLGAATLLEMRKYPYGIARRAAVAAATFVNSYFVYLWGTRTIAVIVVAVLLLGSDRLRQIVGREAGNGVRPAGRSVGQARVARLVLAALAVVIVAIFLRNNRAATISAHGDLALVNANNWRKISLSVNAVYFDATILAVQDEGRSYAYPTGVDFVDGVRSMVPNVIWPGKDVKTPGQRFRSIYEPKTVNGWPVGGPTLWYLNFGLLGVVVGGYLSGLILRLLVNAWRRADTNPYNTAMVLVTFSLVLQLGLTSETPLRAVTWWLPLLLVSAFIQQPRRGSLGHRTAAERPAVRPVAPSTAAGSTARK